MRGLTLGHALYLSADLLELIVQLIEVVHVLIILLYISVISENSLTRGMGIWGGSMCC